MTLVVLSVISYAIIQLPPGDFVDIYIQEFRWKQIYASEEQIQQMAQRLRDQYGLDEPLYVQYGKWAGKMVRGDFGMSMHHGLPISTLVGEKILMTVILALATVLFTWIMAIPIGIYSAVRQRSIEDYTFTFLGFIGLATPDFMLALVMMYFSFVWFDFDIGGLFSREFKQAPWSFARVWDLAKHLLIPCIILGTSGTASLIRILRANLLDELRRPYVITARAKGLPELRVIMKYPVRVALNPLISTVGYILPFLISGSVIVSAVLSLPTLGPVLLKSTLTQDMFVAATIIMILGLMTVIGTLISDVLLVLVDPRIRIEGQ
jgi:peptide/nickel transport system permease protein